MVEIMDQNNHCPSYSTTREQKGRLYPEKLTTLPIRKHCTISYMHYGRDFWPLLAESDTGQCQKQHTGLRRLVVCFAI